MSLLETLLGRRRLVLATAALLALAGVFAWSTMPREEDPPFPHRSGLVVVSFPGADAETVERLVTQPLEEALAEVEEIRLLHSTTRAGVALLRPELAHSIYDTDSAWDEVRKALDRARGDLPSGVSEPVVEDDLVSQEAVVLAIGGSADPLLLADVAERLERQLLSLPGVKRIELIGDPGEQVIVEYDDSTARRLGIDAPALGRLLAGRSRIVPGGSIALGARQATLRPLTDFSTIEELRQTPLPLPFGASVPLGAVAEVRRAPSEPAGERMRWNGALVVGLGIVPRSGIDRVGFGDAVRERLDQLRPGLEPFTVEEVVFQPDHVARRLSELGRSLQLGILIVAAVLFAFMGARLGLLVAAVIPLVAFGSVAIFAAGGGILHQISIAAVVIALGMLVDNAIVVAEAIQWRLDRGESPRQAAVESVRELALPLGSATGTTLAAFVPMLLSKGPTADFTRAIPVLIMITLSVSYLFAVLVTPVLAELLLAPRRGGASEPPRFTDRIGKVAAERSGLVLAGAAALVLATIAAAGLVEQQFFPSADRSLAIVELQRPEGTPIEETDAMAMQVERALLGHPRVTSVASFVGRAAPHFYYNLMSKPSSPHRAELVVDTSELAAVPEVVDWVRRYVRRELPDVEVVARRLEQGPPIEAPVEVRLYGDDLADLSQASDAVLAALRTIPGTRDVRPDLSLGIPTVTFAIDDAMAQRHGLSRADVAQALLGRTLGSEVGQYRAGDDPVPILVRSSAGEAFPVADLPALDVTAAGAAAVPLGHLARIGIDWRPAALQHRNGVRLTVVRAQLEDGTVAQEVLAALAPLLDAADLPAGVRVEIGGEAEKSGEANSAILRQMPIGILLLLAFLLAEFNSFRRVAIILVTVPLAATGVVPGLLISGQPFGFMSMLGVISLVGIVVNNAIVLLEVIERRRAEGASVDEALRDAVARRWRPILLTMATTVAGLSPLAFSGATLWPPLAWAMISGLIASTALTLLVVPALYRLLFGGRRRRTLDTAAAALLLCGLLATPATAEPPLRLTMEEAMSRAATSPTARAASLRADAARLGAVAERRRTRLPSVGVEMQQLWRDQGFEIDTPLGSFDLGGRQVESVGVELRQPLFDAAAMLFATPAAESTAAAADLDAHRHRQRAVAAAADAYLQVQLIDAQLHSSARFVEALAARLTEAEARVSAGRLLAAEALKLRLELESAELDRAALLRSRNVATRVLARSVGVAGHAEPSPTGPALPPPLPDDEEVVERALADRPDLAALEAQLAAARLRADAVLAERLPRLSASGRWSAANGDPFLPDRIAEAMIVLSWSPLAAGSRAPRAASRRAEAAALELELEDARRGVRLEVEAALARRSDAMQALAVRSRGVELAEETLRVERQRHAAGRSTTNDLIAAEAAFYRQEAARETARIEVQRTRIGLLLATGLDPATLEGGTGQAPPPSALAGRSFR